MPLESGKQGASQANPPRASDYTKDLLKDWLRLSDSGRYDMNMRFKSLNWS